MMLKIIVTILLICCSYFGASGESKQEIKKPSFTIYTSVFDYLPERINSGTYNLGTDITLNPNHSLDIYAGYIDSYGPSSSSSLGFDIDAEKNTGWTGSVTFKRYLNRRTFWTDPPELNFPLYPNSGAYYALKLFTQYTKTERLEEIDHEENLYFVNRYAFGLALNSGYKVVDLTGITAEFSISFGARYVTSNPVDRIGSDRRRPNNQTEGIFTEKLFDRGSDVLAYLSLNAKVGFTHLR